MNDGGKPRKALRRALIALGAALALAIGWMTFEPLSEILGRSTDTLAGTSWRNASEGAIYFAPQGSVGSMASADGSVTPFSYREEAGFAECLLDGGGEMDATRYGSDRLLVVGSGAMYRIMRTE